MLVQILTAKKVNNGQQKCKDTAIAFLALTLMYNL